MSFGIDSAGSCATLRCISASPAMVRNMRTFVRDTLATLASVTEFGDIHAAICDQNLGSCYFLNKEPVAFLKPDEVLNEMHAHLGGACRKMGSPVATVGGVADHVHILCQLGKNSSSDLVGGIKKTSSKWIKKRGGALGKFYWQNGYGAFSVGQSQLPAVKKYIRNQAAHHRKEDFKTEYRRFLRLYQVDFDEKYIWD